MQQAENPLLELSNVSVQFPIKKGVLQRTVAKVVAVADVSFSINKGEAYGLVGESGCGKTTLARALDPAQINQVLQFQITSNVLSGLMHINPELIAEGDLAESWTVADDGLSYVFKLREGVTFHNGVSKRSTLKVQSSYWPMPATQTVKDFRKCN